MAMVMLRGVPVLVAFSALCMSEQRKMRQSKHRILGVGQPLPPTHLPTYLLSISYEAWSVPWGITYKLPISNRVRGGCSEINRLIRTGCIAIMPLVLGPDRA